MSATTLPYQPPQPVARKVARLRLLIRIYVLAEGLAALAIAVGVAFWLGLAVDWLWEPRPAMRMALWGLVAAAAAYVAWRYLARRLWANLRTESLALLVERRFPELAEGLITTVGAVQGSAESEVHRLLVDRTAQRTVERLHGVDLSRLFDLRPLTGKMVVAIGLCAAIGAFAFLKHDAFGFWVQRMQLSEELWPRRVQLTVLGFEDRGGQPVLNVARDDEFELEALASIVNGHEAPAEVEVRWRRSSDGGRGGGPMLQIGEAVPGRDADQRYRYAFKVSSDIEFDVIGGDDRIRNLRLRAVERPTVTRVTLECRYPEYMNRLPRVIAASGRVELPEGASAKCRIEANKPLVLVRVYDPETKEELPAEVAVDRQHEFTFFIAPGAVDRTYLITLRDVDGVENREPFRLTTSIKLDAPPEVAVQLRGIGAAITPQARISWAGKISDDYGLSENWFEYQIDDALAQQRPFAVQPDGMAEVRITEAFDLTDADPRTTRPRVEVNPGQKLTLWIAARDAYDLGASKPDTAQSETSVGVDGHGHVGSSNRFQLEVVTASQLRSLLEKREIGLRERFEAIYEKMVGVDELIGRIDLADEVADADDSDDLPGGSATRADAQRQKARITGSRQSATQLAFETVGVAEGFDEILAELANNRVDTEELTQRLADGISAPLKEIGGAMLPQLEEMLGVAQDPAATGADSVESLAAARLQAEEVVQAMKQVLDRMLELESYNEIVELLRGIVSDHEQLKEQTQNEQREKLRGLLDE